MPHENRTSEELQRCIQECLDCHRICLQTVDYCLTLGGKHSDATHVRTMLDCAEICVTAANFMLRGSDYHMRTCGICAELCTACADSCQSIGPHDKTMQQCIEFCRRCATSCRSMAGMTA